MSSYLHHLTQHSTRERFAAHSADIQCEGCHRLIDPIGLGFENYDGIGRYREQEGGSAVDDSGSVKRLSGEDTNFVGIAELADILAQDDEVSACYSRQWLRFGFGETEGLQTDCYAKSLHQDLQNQGHRLKSVVAGLTRTTPFSPNGSLNERDAPAVELMPDAPGSTPTNRSSNRPRISPIQSAARHQQRKQCRHKRSRLTINTRDDRWNSGYYDVSPSQTRVAKPLTVGRLNLTLAHSAWNVVRHLQG